MNLPKLNIARRFKFTDGRLELILPENERFLKSKSLLKIGDSFIASDDGKTYMVKGFEAFMLADPLIGGILVEEVDASL